MTESRRAFIRAKLTALLHVAQQAYDAACQDGMHACFIPHDGYLEIHSKSVAELLQDAKMDHILALSARIEQLEFRLSLVAPTFSEACDETDSEADSLSHIAARVPRRGLLLL